MWEEQRHSSACLMTSRNPSCSTLRVLECERRACDDECGGGRKTGKDGCPAAEGELRMVVWMQPGVVRSVVGRVVGVGSGTRAASARAAALTVARGAVCHIEVGVAGVVGEMCVVVFVPRA